MEDTINIKIKLNVDYQSASELYDEIESYLALCFETIIERQTNTKLENIITPIALTGFLAGKLDNPLIKVEEVKVYTDPMNYDKNIFLSIFAPNVWAIKYGKDTESQLAEALHYFGHETTAKLEDLSITDKAHIFNGLPVSPLIGSIYYDQLSHSMKRWDGTYWNHLS